MHKLLQRPLIEHWTEDAGPLIICVVSAICGGVLMRRHIYPLTMPLTVGPGSISVAVTLGANATHRYGFNIATMLTPLIAMTLIAVSIFLCYGFSDRLSRMLGKTAMTVIIRLSSFLLLCIGVQIMWNGTNALLSSLSIR